MLLRLWGDTVRVVVQRVSKASVKVDGNCVGKIQQGFLLLVGITHTDTIEVIKKMAKKCAELRVFEDEFGKMNKSLADVQGAILSISQFTLYADCRKGRRPGFEQAARPEVAKPLYEAFNETLRTYDLCVETGIFGADMKVELLNDGPITIIYDSKEMGME